MATLMINSNFLQSRDVKKITNNDYKWMYVNLFFDSVRLGSQIGLVMRFTGSIEFEYNLPQQLVIDARKYLQEAGLVIYDEQEHLYLLTKYFELCPFSKTRPNIFAKKILKELKECGSKPILEYFVKKNRPSLVDLKHRAKEVDLQEILSLVGRDADTCMTRV